MSDTEIQKITKSLANTPGIDAAVLLVVKGSEIEVYSSGTNGYSEVLTVLGTATHLLTETQ